MTVKDKLIIGIDVSKDCFDTWSCENGHAQFENNAQGFLKFFSTIKPASWIVMEATGTYHHQLANYLFDKDVRLSVVNPLIIKRYIQMKLRRFKTDKSDARMIALYGSEQALIPWHPDPEYIDQSKVIQTVLQLYFKQSTSLKNKLHSLKAKGLSDGLVIRSLKLELKRKRTEIEKLENELLALIKENEPELLTCLTSIPGIGKKTAIMLIVASDGFKRFVNCNQMISFLGLAPCERTSGSSVRGTSRISKSGQALLRNHLFMCSFTACEHNPACKALYDRLVNKGKSKKLALIAVCNKLVKQAFGVAKSKMPFDKNYRSNFYNKKLAF